VNSVTIIFFEFILYSVGGGQYLGGDINGFATGASLGDFYDALQISHRIITG
jgi:hypothetical protein